MPRLLALIQDPNSNPEDIIEVIRLDPVLTARLIATCKSAAFKRGEVLSSVDDAIRCLGFIEVYKTVTWVAITCGFADHFLSYEDTPDALWRRTVLAGYFMEEFADESGGNRLTNYSSGLLHALGIFYIDRHCADRQLPSIPIENRAEQLSIERDIIGLYHTELSAMILDYWGFPDSVTNAIRLCDKPESERALCPSAVELALSIQLASASKTYLEAIANQQTGEDLLSPCGTPLAPIVRNVLAHLQSAERFLAF